MSNADSENDLPRYQWTPQPAAAQFVNRQVGLAMESCAWLKQLAERLRNETGTRLVDWIDHIMVNSPDQLESVGYLQRVHDESVSYEHSEGIFPAIVVAADVSAPVVGLKVESVDDFLAAHGATIVASEIDGDAGDQLRIARLEFENGGRVAAVERHGVRGVATASPDQTPRDDAVRVELDLFRERSRSLADPQSAFADAERLIRDAASAIGLNHACDLFFRAEREYWQAKNKAASIQYQRQAALGIGWANHDHHTYRCSREWFAPLIRVLEQLGFECRERFYAGKDAGWGAQVLEHAVCGIVIFADVDMSEAELAGDFAHDGLPASEELGTVGLWCKLHGDSFLAAGMHHLECQFDFDAAREQLAEAGIKTMAPFTDTPYLKQAFTQGEFWQVPAERMTELVASGAISQSDAERFSTTGALGSHLEILERNEGYKGFNQTGISKIILKTDPRNET